MDKPLVNKYLFDMIKFVKEYGVGTEIITNGSLLNQKNINLLHINNYLWNSANFCCYNWFGERHCF